MQTEKSVRSDPRLKFLMTLRVNNRSQGFHTGTEAPNLVVTFKRRYLSYLLGMLNKARVDRGKEKGRDHHQLHTPLFEEILICTYILSYVQRLEVRSTIFIATILKRSKNDG